MGFLVLSARFWPGSATGGRRCAGAPSWGARRQPCLPGRFFPSRGGERKSARRAGHGRSPRRRARDPLAAGRGYRVGMEGPVGPGPDAGLFGPDSVSWRVLRESSVVVGGLRALLMHAAHPLVVAGARQTGMYERDPWRRLERTLRQTFTVVFGTRQEAEQASRRIDDVHGVVKGIDQVTGLPYDARDPELLLWVHACLVSSFLELERRTIGKLGPQTRQRFHEEQALTAEPLRLPRERVPPTVEALEAYIREVVSSGILRPTEDAMSVASLVRDPPEQVPRRWLWRLISFLAFHTLPPELRELYQVRHSARHELALRAVCWTMRHDRPLMPPRWRFIAPALLAGARLRGEPAQVSGAGLFLRGVGWHLPRLPHLRPGKGHGPSGRARLGGQDR